jgi:hypothetical protein
MKVDVVAGKVQRDNFTLINLLGQSGSCKDVQTHPVDADLDLTVITAAADS